MSSQATASQVFKSNPLVPLFDEKMAKELPVNISPNLSLTKGTILGMLSSAAAAVQTVTLASAGTGDTFTLSGTNPLTDALFTTAALAYNASAATVQTELVKSANYGAGNVTVTGSAGGPYTVTFAGSMVNMAVVTMTAAYVVNTHSATISVVTTTVGQSAGTYAPYSAAVVAAPTTAPSLTAAGTDGTIGAGTYAVTYTFVNANGETTPSPAAYITLTATQHIAIASITSIPATVTTVNVYVSDIFTLAQTVTSSATGAFTVTATNSAAGTSTPLTNTAYTAPNGAGTQKASCILKYDCSTDAEGNCSPNSKGVVGGEWGQVSSNVPAYFSGVFDTSKLTGLDALAVTQLGRLWYGTTTSGALRVF